MGLEVEKINIRNLAKDDLETWFTAQKHPKFRVKQVYEWMDKKHILDFDLMTNLSKKLREDLNANFTIPVMTKDTFQQSADGTMKFRFRLYDGYLIESVLIPVPADNRYTVCISTQVGCSLSCKFCATGLMKRERNLQAYEIVDQVVEVNKKCEKTYGKSITNIVYMGMGEPLLAYKPVLGSIEKITSEDGLGMSARRLTISTAGIAKMIMKLADDQSKVNLALSLHAADDEKRKEIMPINEQNNLSALIEALKYYYIKTKNRISYEYIAFKGFNDSAEDARKLVKLCKHFPVRVNIIEYNPIEGLTFQKSSADQLDKFMKILKNEGVTVTLRRSRGKDIDAACGQLANKD